jgi:alanine racemase
MKPSYANISVKPSFATSRLELSRQALEHNLAFIRRQLKPDVRYSSVVKGNAYGHGIEEFVPLAEACGVDHFSTFSADEAYRVKNCLSGPATLLIMGMIDREQMEWAISNQVEFYVFDLERLEHAREVAERIRRPARVHLELETGMNRTGFEPEQLPQLVEYCRTHSRALTLAGLCTHFAGAESISNFLRVKHQRKYFRRAKKWLEKQNARPECIHAACSAATIRHPDTHYDMVRIGILQYGFWPSPETRIEYLQKNQAEDKNPLRRVISWKSRVMDLKTVKAGEHIGYGTTYLANDPMKIATIPIGYAHGFSRSLSNQGRVLIRGRRVSVVGMVNMNVIIVDATHIQEVERGDEVVLIGHQDGKEISVASFSEFSSQVNYEMLTRLPLDIPRMTIE